MAPIGKYTVIGAILDLFDWLGIGLIPLIGDAVDILAVIFWYTRVGILGIGSAIEVVPLADILPINIAIGLYADNMHRGKSKQ